MTHAEIARRLRDMAGRRPTDIWRELHALAMDLEQRPRPVKAITGPIPDADMEALVRATQPPTRRPGLLASILRGLR